MALHRRQLPIVSPCDGFVGREATDHAPAFCTRCEKAVHDVSRLTEREVITLLARHLGGELCLSYRTRDDGAIVMRNATSRLAPVAIAASLAGCAGHLGEADARAQDCVDVDGYRIDCPQPPRLDQAVFPDAIDDASVTEEAPTEIAGVTPGEIVEVAGTVSRGLVVVEALPAPPPPPPPASVPMTTTSDPCAEPGAICIGGTGTAELGPIMTRRVAREAKRIERRERRRARRERGR